MRSLNEAAAIARELSRLAELLPFGAVRLETDPAWCFAELAADINRMRRKSRQDDATIAAIKAELDLWAGMEYLTDREQTMNLVGALRGIIAGEEE